MLRIVTCGLAAASASAGSAVRALEPADGTADPLDEVTAAVTPTSPDETVLVLVSDRVAEPLSAHLEGARSALATTRLVLHRTGLPPLAGGAMATLLAEVARRDLVTESVLLSHLDLIEQHVAAVAWLGSVARLHAPAPPLRLHARSYLPGSAFSAFLAEEARVVALPRAASTMRLPQPRLPGDWHVTLAAGEQGDEELARRSLREQLPRASVDTVPLSATSREWWGTDQLVELAFVPAHLPALADLLGTRPTRACDWCGRTIAPGLCPFCRYLAAPAPEPAETGGAT